MGAHLLARVVKHYAELLKPQYDIQDVFLWTDSTIVLDWLHTPAHLLKIFCANRVAEILDWTSLSDWNHTPGVLNPADVASRGMLPRDLVSCPVWWEGPSFLHKGCEFWPTSVYSRQHSDEELEMKPLVSLVVSNEKISLFTSFSSWTKVVRIVSYILKWLFLVRSRSVDALYLRQMSLKYLVRCIQHDSALRLDLQKVTQGALASRPVQRLCPYIDDFGLLRARGRLAHSADFKNKDLIVLPKHHHLVHLLIRHYHVWLGHAGPAQVQYQLSLTYWILSARRVVRQIINECVVCFKVRPKLSCPLMGDLPPCRVNPAPPFFHTGMDFCGPFSLRSSNLRKAPLIKAYICIFICMCVKAIHIEVAIDLSSQEFLDCLRRFIGRRGTPKVLYSDCGLNFVGSRSLLSRELQIFVKEAHNSKLVTDFALDNDIDFVFSCPSAPHQNGLWERAVKSTKYHLRRIIGTQVLTITQFSSLTTRIEGVLNSRPLMPIPGTPGDCEVLTPGHFLIGRPITAPPTSDLQLIKDGNLRHFQLVEALHQRFWRKWRNEYLTTLQARSKWTEPSRNLQIDDVVILNEPNTPPYCWPLGRIVKVLPGPDGVVRRAVVQTTSGRYERPAVKLFRLPQQTH